MGIIRSFKSEYDRIVEDSLWGFWGFWLTTALCSFAFSFAFITAVAWVETRDSLAETASLMGASLGGFALLFAIADYFEKRRSTAWENSKDYLFELQCELSKLSNLYERNENLRENIELEESVRDKAQEVAILLSGRLTDNFNSALDELNASFDSREELKERTKTLRKKTQLIIRKLSGTDKVRI